MDAAPENEIGKYKTWWGRKMYYQKVKSSLIILKE